MIVENLVTVRNFNHFPRAILKKVKRYFNRIKFREIKFWKFFEFNFVSQRFEKFRVDLISRMSLKTAENDNFWAQMESFDWFLHPKCDFKFRVDLISRVSNLTRFCEF